jgi:hypothetical protein
MCCSNNLVCNDNDDYENNNNNNFLLKDVAVSSDRNIIQKDAKKSEI